MPLYSFAVRDSVEFEDPELLEFPNLTAAIKAAREIARELTTSGAERGEDRNNWYFEIHDERGRVLTSIRFADAADADLDSPPSLH